MKINLTQLAVILAICSTLASPLPTLAGWSLSDFDPTNRNSKQYLSVKNFIAIVNHEFLVSPVLLLKGNDA